MCVCVCVCVHTHLCVSCCHVWLFVTLWTVARQTLLSMKFSRQEYWSGLSFPSPGNLPNPGIKPGSPALQTDCLLSEPPGKPRVRKYVGRCQSPGVEWWGEMGCWCLMLTEFQFRRVKIQEMDGFKFILATQPSVQPCHLLDPRWLLLLLATFPLTTVQNSIKGSYFFLCIPFNK